MSDGGVRGLNRPLLTTRELAQLKWQVDDGTRDTYIEADAAERRAILADLAGEPLDVTLTDLATPVAPDAVAWFASTFAFATTLLNSGPIDQGAVTPVVEGALDLLTTESG